MEMHQCEKCHRTVEPGAFMKFKSEQHSGYVCTTCHYILSKEDYAEGFIYMLNQKTYEQSNDDMKRVHLLLSRLITVGVICLVVMVSSLAFYTIGKFPTLDVLISYFSMGFVS